MDYRIMDVLANYIITLIMKLRMVAELIVHLRGGPLHCKEQRVAERELLPCHYRVNSALLAK
eukprot:5219803-Amphidinium_carterae.1